jgi:RNA-directed DNA polymerase
MSEMLERILEPHNMAKAYRKVVSNGGAGGVDGVGTEELKDYIITNWKRISEEIRNRTYRPQPVRRVEIPEPNGGERKPGVPTAMDRVIEQAMVQVLSPIFEPAFSDYSYGFRPGGRCQDAIVRLLGYLNEGCTWIVDIDLEKFFDNVPQDRLMSYVGRVIHDGDTESLIRKYLKAGVMVDGRFEATDLGTPQGGNLSPLLSNIMLTELDRELESRGLGFTRYADDCVIAVASEASAKRVMYSITTWIERRLGLKVNMTKTHVTRPNQLKYLGFSFWDDRKDGQWKARPHETSIAKFKLRLHHLCRRSWSVSFDERVRKLNEVIRGWINYFLIGNMKTALTRIDGHLRTMIRMVIWKQWKVPKRRAWGLGELGMDKDTSKRTAYWGDRYMYVATKSCLVKAVSKEILKKRNMISCLDYYLERHDTEVIRTAVCRTARTVV